MNKWRTRRRLRLKTEKFLKEHNVNTQAYNDPDAGTPSSTNGGFHLLEYTGDKIVKRPGRILGNLRKHTVRQFTITRAESMEAMLEPLSPTEPSGYKDIGAIPGGLLPQHRVNSDTTPDLTRMKNSAIDMSKQKKGSQVFGPDLNGCVIKRKESLVHHITPPDGGSGVRLQSNLGSRETTFGPKDYDTSKTHFQTVRKSSIRGRVQVLSQTTDSNNLPRVTKKILR